LAQLLHHVSQVLDISLSHVHAWIDSTIVLNRLSGSPRCFKTFVGSRVFSIMELILPEKWRSASRGLFPSELFQHELWWIGPLWIKQSPADWSRPSPLPPNNLPEEEKEMSVCECNTRITCCTIRSLLKLQSPETYHCMGLSFYQQVSKACQTKPSHHPPVHSRVTRD